MGNGTSEQENDTSSNTESDSEDERYTEDNSWKNMDLKSLGLKLHFTSKADAQAVSKNKFGKWSVEKRNQNLMKIPTEHGDFICSDIYQVEGPRIQATEDMTVTVTLGKALSLKRHKVKVKRKANGKWETEVIDLHPASFRKRCRAVFKTRQFEEFAIVGCVKMARILVSPAGTKVKVDASSKVTAFIPAGAVDKDQEMDFRIIPPDPHAVNNYVCGENPVCKSVVGVTECLYGDSKTDLTFKKSVTVELPVDKKPKEGEATPILFRMVGNEIRMMNRDTKLSLSADGVFNLEVSSFSGYCVAMVRPGSGNDVKATENEVSLLYGMNSLAKILVFRERELMNGARFPRVWVELVDKVRVNNVVKMRTQEEGFIELRNSRSADIKVENNYRLTFELAGNIKGDRSIPKNFYLITYLEVADDNHKIFPVEMKEAGGRLGIVNFFHGRDCIHSVQMDTQGFDRAVQNSIRPSSSVTWSAAGADDQGSMGSGGSGYATLASIGNDGSVAGAAGVLRKQSAGSTDSANSPLSVSRQCKAFNDSSLFIMANTMGSDDGWKMSVQLGMADVFDSISQRSLSQRQANFKLLKEWVKMQTSIQESSNKFKKGLNAIKLFKIEKAFQKAVLKNSEVSERDIK